MGLYHFTSVTSMHAIMASDGINKGYIHLGGGEFYYDHSWYTTSPLPYGHGLCDGKTIPSASQQAFAIAAAGPNASGSAKLLTNKRLIRLTVDLDWLKKQNSFLPLKKLMKEYNLTKNWAIDLAVAGWVDIQSLSEKEKIKWRKSKKLKHETWYVNKGQNLPVERILSVEFMEGKDNYVPYDFEKHGRLEFERSGMYAVTAQQLDEINNLISSDSFSGGNVYVIFPHPKFPPSIVFRKRNSLNFFSISDGSLMSNHGCSLQPAVIQQIEIWVKKHSTDLYTLWNKSEQNWRKVNS